MPYSDETLEEKRKIIKNEWNKFNIIKAIVISDSLQKSCIGNGDECLELFKEDSNVRVALGVNLETGLNHLKDLIITNKKIIAGIKLFPGMMAFVLTIQK